MILGRVVKMSDLDESKRNDLAGLPFYRSPPLSQRRLWPFMGIPAINTLSVTPLNAFLAKAAVFNNPWETSRPISTLIPRFQPIDRTVERKKKPHYCRKCGTSTILYRGFYEQPWNSLQFRNCLPHLRILF